jgi:hypothetical protein
MHSLQQKSYFVSYPILICCDIHILTCGIIIEIMPTLGLLDTKDGGTIFFRKTRTCLLLGAC